MEQQFCQNSEFYDLITIEGYIADKWRFGGRAIDNRHCLRFACEAKSCIGPRGPQVKNMIILFII